MTNDAMSPLFEAVFEATEEAVYNSMFKATTVTGHGHTVEAPSTCAKGRGRRSKLATSNSSIKLRTS
jgi:L-aminopeptidase/D-esterase-like protein